MNKLIAYHGKSSIKKKYLARVRAHRKADEIIKGTYWENGKGCAVGCTVHSGSHSAYETELGIPRIVARLEDGIFEGLPNEEALSWPERFLKAIKPGVNLSRVCDQFLHWLLVDPQDGVIRFAKTEKTKSAIQTVGDLYARKLAGETISAQTWRNAADAAYAAYAATAADAAYAAYAATAAAYAATAAAAAADAAAYAAVDATYAAAARSKARIRQSEKLIELLEAAPIST